MNKTAPSPLLLAIAATVMAPLSSLAAPVETVDLVAANANTSIDSRGNATNTTVGEPNTVVTITPTSAATIRSITFTGTVSKIKSGTFASEARIGITRPGSAEVLVQPMLRSSFIDVHGVTSWRYVLPAGTVANSGAWTFRFYESFIDSGAGPDSQWTSLSVTFDDASTPAGVVNLGTLGGANTTIIRNDTLSPNGVLWYRVTVPAATTSPNFVDIHSLGTALGATNNNALALYNAATGARVALNDNYQVAVNQLAGMAFSSSTAGPRTYAPYTTNFASQNGNLAAGDYLLAVFAGPAGTGWSATATLGRDVGFNVGTEAPFVISDFSGPSRVTLLTSGATTNPIGVAALDPTGVVDGGSTLYTVAVTAGANPTSTGITVTADLSGVGGSATSSLLDNGTNGDVTAGDGIYSRTVVVPAGTAAGAYPLAYVIADAQSRSSTGSVNLTVANAPVAEDLGTLSPTNGSINATTDLAANTTKWYRLNIAQAADASRFVDFSTYLSNLTPSNDTEIGLYNANGGLVAANDDSGAGGAPNNFLSLLSFGQTAPSRTYLAPVTNSLQTATGQTGATLAAGTYYIAVTSFNAGFASPFTVTTPGANAGPLTLSIRTNSSLPTPPTASFTIAPNSLIEGFGQTTLLTVSTLPGQNPTSTGIAVTANLTSVGGSATAQLFDDGTNGDVTAGDGVFSLSYTVPVDVTAGAKTINYTVTDAQSRTATGSGTLNITPVINLGTLTSAGIINTAGTIAANGIAWYRVTLPEATDSVFVDMNTVGSLFAGSADAELGIYAADGTLVASNDDFGGSLNSSLSFGGTTGTGRTYTPFTTDCAGQNGLLTAGTYYLAVGRWNVNFLPNFSVNSTGGAAGTITLNLYTNAGAGGGGCNVADITGIGGPPAIPDGLLTGDDFNAFVGAFASGDLLADITGIGGPPATPDGLITGDDFNAFIAAFAAGCP